MAGLFLVVGAAGCATSEASPARHEEEVAPSASAEHQEPGAHASASGSAHGPVHADHPWAYTGDKGPTNWGDLDPKWEQCEVGKNQSPIDLPAVGDEPHGVDKLSVDYMAVPLRVKHNGHTVEVQNRTDSFITIGNKRFDLLQFHFHSPSEEMIDGQQFDMVVHLVHKDGEGRLAVVAVLVEAGARQPALQAVLNNLPLEKGMEVMAGSNLDLNQILPDNRKYFTYMGSLTTPPCTEDVLWIVMKQPVQATAEQMNLFARMYPMNARPIQSARGRTIKESN